MPAKTSLDDLAAFAAVAQARSFTRAAAGMRVSTSALSHTVKALEARLGVRLLQRTSRSVALTDEGERLLRTLAPALSDIESALLAIDGERASVSGSVRLTATLHAYETLVRPALPAFLDAHPRARVEVLIDYQFRDIVADRLDAGIRLGEKLAQDMVAVRLGAELRMAVVAAPAYLARHGAPQTPADLTAHRCVNYRLMASGQTYDWEFAEGERRFVVKVDGPLGFNAPEPMLEAALDGLGIAYVLESEAAAHVESGRLLRLLEAWTAPFPGYFLYYPSRRQVTATLAALIDALREAAKGVRARHTTTGS